MEQLRDVVLHYVRSFLRALNFPNDIHTEGVLREVRILKDRAIQKITPVSMEADVKLLTQLGEDARKILKDSLEGSVASRGGSRSRFRETILALDGRAPKTFHEAIVRVAAEAMPFFEALVSDLPKARELHDSLDRQLQEILKDIGKLK
jgi:hypothetical protein